MALARTFVRSATIRTLARLSSSSAEHVTDGENVDVTTHTGQKKKNAYVDRFQRIDLEAFDYEVLLQVWDKEDYRRIRFVDTAKQVYVGYTDGNAVIPLGLVPDGITYVSNSISNIYLSEPQNTVNPYFAIDLIEEDPVVVVNASSVWSDSGGAMGHPKVYINLDRPQVGVCGYSGRKFIQKKFYDEKTHGPSITYEQYLEEVRPKPRN